ncbi:MAG: M48 family metalloprotease [Aquificae bacterium]|nr:M48 family metalloprotease [Aquificota bacterium]
MKRIILLLIIPLFFISCASTYDPLTGKKVYTLLPPEKEIKIGKMYVPLAIEQNHGRYPDKEVQEYVSQIGERIAKVVPRKLDYQFYVVNTSAINAFALPGGFIFVNRGLILALNKENELAGVIAHELGHVNARHHARFLEKMYGLSFLYNIAAIFISQTRYADLLLQFSKIGAQLLSLKWSRDHEKEADILGIRFAYEAGYDPRGLLDTFKIFESLQKTEAPEWLLTHPLPKTRYKYVQELISKYDLTKPLIVDTPRFQEIKRKLLATKKSYDLYDKAIKILSQKKPNLYEAFDLLTESIRLYPNNNASLTARASIYVEKKEFRKAAEDAIKAAKLDDLYFSPHFIAGYALFELRNYEESVKYLERAKELIPSFPDTYYYLGRIYEALGKYKEAAMYYRQALKLTDGRRGWERDAARRLRRLGL